MLIKEYRILFPMSVEEYKIGQLYMIQKMSRLESEIDGGVEIITNEPYDDGPGGSGQYTFKIYHIGNKIPSWIRNVLPSAALQANEEAWNAYPFTRTRHSSPLMDRFSIEIETLYFNDTGTQNNVFKLSGSELKNRVVDVIDFVKDSHDCPDDENPRIYKSAKTNRGPLSDDWVKEYVQSGKPIMCAYKLCKVEFRYWGMQTRVERWIHDLALKSMLLKSHLKAWIWQDEWVGLKLEDIRKLENETALYLSKVMSSNNKPQENPGDSDSSSDVFFDCNDGSPPTSNKPSLIRWSSELLVGEGESPPSTPKLPNSSLLVLVFHGDVYPESPADSKTTDSSTLRSTLDSLILNHYPQLKNKVHVRRVTCGSELNKAVANLSALSPTFGAFHPSLSLLLAAGNQLNDAVEGTISRANKAVEDFYNSPEGKNFCGEIFIVGDCIGGILMYEMLYQRSNYSNHLPISRHSSSISAQSRPIPEGKEDNWSLHDFENNAVHTFSTKSNTTSRNLSAPPMSAPPSSSHQPFLRKKISTCSVDPLDFPGTNSLQPSDNLHSSNQHLNFRPSTAFLLGCPLALILMQQKLNGRETEGLDCNQLFNLFYSLDSCGARLEPVLNSQLSVLPAVNVPRYQRFPLGDGRHLLFDQAATLCNCATLWGPRRVDHLLYCPPEMVALPSSALPNILHASYWESKDVGAFILRQFVRTDDAHAAASFSTTGASNAPLNIDMPSPQWNRRRTRFKIANLSANHRANDVIVVEGSDQIVNAKFCYGPMDLVTLSREKIYVCVCPYGGEWYLSSTEYTDAHGKLTVNLRKQQLAIGIHTVKMIVAGDHSYLDMYVAVVPPETHCVIFSIDGSLTGSVSVTGRDPRIRPGAVDVVRYWQQQGYLIIYVTARPDMQQKVVGSWLAQHNFPHGLLFFTPSLSTDPLRHKTQHLKHLHDLGLKIQAAYGSNKDVPVYANSGVEADRIFSVSSSKRRGCVSLEDGYAQHLHDLIAGRVSVAQLNVPSSLIIDNNYFTTLQRQTSRLVQRTHSFTPRSGKYDSFNHHNKKSSQISIITR
jgi:hypothetical protein